MVRFVAKTEETKEDTSSYFRKLVFTENPANVHFVENTILIVYIAHELFNIVKFLLILVI